MDRNSSNLLAYDLAVIYGHDELIDFLIEHMNQVVPAVDKQADDGTTALMRAAMVSDVKAIKELLAAGADSSRRDRQGQSPLSYAVAQDMDEVAQALRAAGVEKLPGDKASGPQAIVHAGSQGALGTILDLLESGTPIDMTDDDGDTALTAAVVHPGVVKVLAKRGADLSHRNHDGKTAYMIAAASNRVRMVETLQAVGSPIDEPAELEELTQMQAMLNALREEASDSDADESDGNSDVDVDGGEFFMACHTGDALTVSRQIAAGVDVNYQNDEGRTPLMMALGGLGLGEMSRRMERDFEQVIDTLLVAGADPNRGMMPPLIIATITGRLHLVSALIRAGADVNVAADLPTGEHDGTMLANALFVALSSNEHDVCVNERIGLLLVRTGIDLAFKSDDGAMAVHCAAQSGTTNTLREILNRVPETISAQNNEGSTPLMLAAAEGHAEAVRLLLELGADRTLKNDEGLTAKDVAIKNRNEDLVPLLT
jgi:ankyrin repeat protein